MLKRARSLILFSGGQSPLWTALSLLFKRRRPERSEESQLDLRQTGQPLPAHLSAGGLCQSNACVSAVKKQITQSKF